MNGTNFANTTTMPVRILVAEDEPEIRDYLQLALGRPNFIVDFVEDGEEVLNAVTKDSGKPSLVILDIMMPRKDGMTALRDIRRHNPDLPIIMLSGLSSTTNVVEAMKNGANNFLAKPASYEELRQAVDLLLPSPPAVSNGTSVLPWKSEVSLTTNWTRDLEPLLERLATFDVPILLQGETGVGKEVLARRIHNQSLRSGKVFLKLNCAALPSELVESELFGYERGSFTGAFKSNPGKFELANGGTILLDEIGDMDLKLQAKLLQVLQDKEFLRIGAKEATHVDVRVIAATHCDLEARIAKGEFREDLYYRLNVVNIVIPPLRERVEEIIPLASFFLRKYAVTGTSVPEIGPDLRSALLRYRWPGNVRQLENLMRRYVVVRNPEFIAQELRSKVSREKSEVASEPPIQRSAVASSVGFASSTEGPKDAETSTTALSPSGNIQLPRQTNAEQSELARVDQERRAAETEVIMKALHSTQWNRKRAAAILGTDYKALLYKMKKLRID